MDESRSIRDLARELALKAGFTEAGMIALPHLYQERDAVRFEEFADAGRGGTMQWLTRQSDDGERLRANVARPFPWARSALVCMANYKGAQKGSMDSAPEGSGWIARYAVTGKWVKRLSGENMRLASADEIPTVGGDKPEDVELIPSDYHRVLLKRLRAVENELKAELGEFESRCFVDTGPVVERTLAVAAGLGWTGKNTCLIHPQLGSWSFLCVLLTSLELPELDLPELADRGASLLQSDRCGSCRKCLDACPTNALYEPYKMDARRCIAYLTIEHKGVIDASDSGEDLKAAMGRQIFGCDICQDVCPWNQKSPIAVDSEMVARPELVNPSLEWLAELDERGFERFFNGSPVRRSGFDGFRRNLAIAMGNSRMAGIARRLLVWSSDKDEGLRKAAQWALSELQQKPRKNNHDVE